jgi:hypothetical protein
LWYPGKVTRRRFIGYSAATAGALGATMLVPASWSAFGQAKPIKVGSLQPLSGGAAIGGKTALVGLQMAVDRINKSGGINGRPVELIVADDESKPDVGRRKMEKLLVEDKVDVHVGGFLSNICLACMPQFEETKVVPSLAFACVAAEKVRLTVGEAENNLANCRHNGSEIDAIVDYAKNTEAIGEDVVEPSGAAAHGSPRRVLAGVIESLVLPATSWISCINVAALPAAQLNDGLLDQAVTIWPRVSGISSDRRAIHRPRLARRIRREEDNASQLAYSLNDGPISELAT